MQREWHPYPEHVETTSIKGWRYIADGSGDVEFLHTDGNWYIYSSGPHAAGDVEFLKSNNIPQYPDREEE